MKAIEVTLRVVPRNRVSRKTTLQFEVAAYCQKLTGEKW